ACTQAANGRYVIRQQTLPKAADDQRLQLARRLVAGDPEVDLMALDVTWTAEFAEAGWIEPWPEEAAAQVEAGTLEGPLETARYQGRLWAAPLNTNTQLLWYRKDLAPQPPQTWDEMIEMSEALHEQGLPSYIEVQAAQYEGISVWFNTLLTSAGGQLVSEDGEVLVDDGDAARKAASIMQRVAASPASDPSLSVAQENDGRLQMEAGLAAFQVNYPFVNASINTPPPDGGGGGTFIDEQGRPTSEDTGRRVVALPAGRPGQARDGHHRWPQHRREHHRRQHRPGVRGRHLPAQPREPARQRHPGRRAADAGRAVRRPVVPGRVPGVGGDPHLAGERERPAGDARLHEHLHRARRPAQPARADRSRHDRRADGDRGRAGRELGRTGALMTASSTAPAEVEPSARTPKHRGKPPLSEGARAERKLAFLLCAPAVIIMVAVTAYPILYALWLS